MGISAVDIIIAIGLCVDYAVHICHAFLTVSGSKRERAHAALVDMGPAVLNGGLSTLISFILTFFKIFFLTVLFGVWHGLVLLPVLLSLVGPGAYSSARSITDPAPCTTVATLDKDGGHKDGGGHPRVETEQESKRESRKPNIFALSCSCSCINHCPS